MDRAQDSADSLRPLPPWVAARPDDGPEDAAFRAGAALAALDHLTTHPAVPQALWRQRLAVAAAETAVRLIGRRDSAASLRDAVHLTRPGDNPGPGGALLLQWSAAVGRKLSAAHLAQVLAAPDPARISQQLAPGAGPALRRAAAVIQHVLTDTPRAEPAALILADAALAQAMGWPHLVPVLALSLRPRDLRLRDDALRHACHVAATAAAGQAVPLAADLARRAARARAVAPSLRAKGAGRALNLFLSRDALAPAALSFMFDRAARRLCDRLVSLGALRELTGRDSFRLYGL